MTAYSFSDMHSVSDNQPDDFQSKPIKKVDARTRILKTALTEFAQRGYEGVSTTEIAKAAGVTQPLIHYHFKSKDALWKASVEQIFSWLHSDFMGLFDSLPKDDPEQMVRTVVRAFLAFSREHPEFGQFILREGTQRSERLDWLINEWMLPPLSKFAETQEMGIEEGWLRDMPFAQIASIVASVSTMFFALGPMVDTLYGISSDDQEQVDAYCDTVVEMVANLVCTKITKATSIPVSPEVA